MRCEQDSRVRDAAIIGETFGIDPVAVLAERNPVAKAIRPAANNLLVRARSGK